MARHDPEIYRAGDPDWLRIANLQRLDKLEAYVAHLNTHRWVRDSGKPYFVASRSKADGTTEHFVDRAP